MKPQNLIIILLYLISLLWLPASKSAASHHTSQNEQAVVPPYPVENELTSVLMPAESDFYKKPPRINVGITPDEVQQIPAVSEPDEIPDERQSLPKSFYFIDFWTVDGTKRRHNGVAIQNNALLSSNHLLPANVSPDEVVRIQIHNVYGDMQTIVNSTDFLIQPSNGYTVVVFRENIIPEANIAGLGNTNQIPLGGEAQQTVIFGASEGTYKTQILGSLSVNAETSLEYQAITVSPDKTTTGDSGSPLYINGVVYGINNAGSGIYGAITDPEKIYQNLHELSVTLNPEQNPTTMVSRQPEMDKRSWKWNPPGQVVAPILLYHRIEDSIQPNRFRVSPENFRLQMEKLMEWGYTPIPMSLLVEALINGASLPQRPVVITFDDGQKSVFENAFPVMKEMNIPGIVYLVSKGIHLDDSLMNIPELKELIAAGWEIGSHTQSHVDLTASHEVLEDEIVQSRFDLEGELPTIASTFAYPFGLMDELVMGCAESGYDAAVGLGKSWKHTLWTRYYLSRIIIEGTYDIEDFARVLPWSSTPDF